MRSYYVTLENGLGCELDCQTAAHARLVGDELVVDRGSLVVAVTGTLFACLKRDTACWRRGQHALSSSSAGKGKGAVSDDGLTSASREGKKTAASHHQTREACPGKRAGHGDIHRPRVASLTAEYVGNEDVQRLFGAVTSAIVALAMVKSRLLAIPRAPFPQVVQLIPKLKFPVPSPLKVPVFACNVFPANV